ncbi:MAG: TetR/AcrR family transcriptional regulator [Streptococcaceae bacterium]|jgi:AcrR family transcriptional regulator|nr:TetR/AcrR family transcriptional regulator [Streptococcaceae bacterium]
MNQTEKKQQAILKTTFHLLNEKEIKDITIEEIAELAEVSKVTIFKYYQNKNHLMNLVIMKAFESMSKEAGDIIHSDLNFEETYQTIIDMELRQVQRYSSIFQKNFMTQYSENPEFSDETSLNTQMALYFDLFEKGQKEGKIAADLTRDDFFFITSIFVEGMKGIDVDTLFKRTPLISRFYINGFA